MNKITADINKRLVIDPLTKTIAPKYRNQKAVYVAKGDNNSVLIGFEIPRYVDGYDMATEGSVKQIHYVNIEEKEYEKGKHRLSKGVSDATDIKVETDEITGKEIVSFCWLVPKTATRYAGVVSVGVTFEEYENVNGKAQEKYSWSTLPYGKTIVWDSHDNNAEAVEQEYDQLVTTCNAIVSESLKSPLEHINEVYKRANESVEVGKKAIETGEQSAKISKSYAVGDTGTREGENEDNAKYYYEQTKISAENVKTSEDKASEHKNNAKLSEDNAKASEEKVEERYAELMKKPFASSLITKKAGTSEVIINDVSPIEHEMKINLSSNNIPLYPYTEWTGIINDDNSIRVQSPNDDAYHYPITKLLLQAGTYRLDVSHTLMSQFGYVGVYVGSYEGGFDIVEPLMYDRVYSVFTLNEEKEIWIGCYTAPELYESQIIADIKISLSKGAEIAPDVSNVEIIVSDKDNNETTYYTDANGSVAVKSIHPITIIRANEDLKLEVEYNKDLDSILEEHKEQIDELSKTAKENQASTEQHFEELGKNVGNIGDRANKNEESIKELQKKINQNTKTVEKLDAGYSGMRKDIGSNAEKINSLNARQNVTDGELLNINGKINSLPSKVYVDNSVSEKERALREAINEKANSKDVNKALEEKAKGLNGIAEKAIADANGNVISKTYATKEEVGKTKGEIEILSEEVKSEIRAVGEQVKNSIPEDYSELSDKVNNTSNALKGKATGAIVPIDDVSPVEHRMGVKVSSKNLFNNDTSLIQDILTDGNGLFFTDAAEGRSPTYKGVAIKVPVGTYVASAVDLGYSDTRYLRVMVCDKAGNRTKAYNFVEGEITSANPIKKLVIEIETDEVIYFYCAGGYEYSKNHAVSWFNSVQIQLEEGSTATEYTPYVDVEDVKLYKAGKNLFNNDTSLLKEISYKTSTGAVATKIGYELRLPAGTYTLSGINKGIIENDFIFTTMNNKNGEHIKQMKNANGTVKENGYIVTGNSLNTVQTLIYTVIYEVNDGDVIYIYDAAHTPNNPALAADAFSRVDLQLELGTVATPCEPYVGSTHTVSKEGLGEGVTSLYPTTILYTDTAGVKIDAEYNRDLNKAFEELYNAIISTGGNV